MVDIRSMTGLEYPPIIRLLTDEYTADIRYPDIGLCALHTTERGISPARVAVLE